MDAGLPQGLVMVIMRLVSRGTCRLVWNEECTDVIKPTRGLRQGCPLSPYLFVLCVERLGQWILKKVGEGRIREVKASWNGPGLNYLFFANDLLLFSEAKKDQLLCFKDGLDLFCRCSGHEVNFHKSSMFFSSNVPEEEAVRLNMLMGIPLKKEVGKYLGHHIYLIGRDRERHKELL